MSGKRKLIGCPQCSAPLIVRRSSFQVATHPLYLKRGAIIINYSKCIETEQRTRLFWLKCSRCFFELAVDDEDLLKNEIGLIAYKEIEKAIPSPILPKKHKHQVHKTEPKQKPLLRIIRPSKQSVVV